NAFQSDPGAGLSPQPAEEPAGSEVAVPLLLIIASVLVMLVIFGFTHIDDLTYLRMVTGENASARAGALFGSLAFWFLLPVIIGLLASRIVKPPRRMKLFAAVFAAVGILTSLGSLAIYHLQQRTYHSQVDQQMLKQ
ncbi:MAG TPA: hypothetical protein VGJ51_16840, partial [Candidatus Angelobacter sp.]